MASSADAPAPAGGPPFLKLNSWPYRLEYAAATILILGVVLVWRLGIQRSLSVEDVGLFVFWVLFPDLAAFVPIGLSARASPTWPRWGSALYNATHSLIGWALVFGVWSLLSGGVVWPLLGWAGHITADRAVGYYLRAPPRPPS